MEEKINAMIERKEENDEKKNKNHTIARKENEHLGKK